MWHVICNANLTTVSCLESLYSKYHFTWNVLPLEWRRSPQLQRGCGQCWIGTILQNMPQSKVGIVGHLMVQDVGTQIGVQPTRALQHALIFPDKPSFVQFQRRYKRRVKLNPGCGGTKPVTATLVEMLRLLQLGIPQWISWWIGLLVCHPDDHIRRILHEHLGVTYQLGAAVRLFTETTNIGPHPVVYAGGCRGPDRKEVRL